MCVRSSPVTLGLRPYAPPIQSCGLLHNLVVTPNGKGYVVIDGNRRLDALKTIYKGKGTTPINCIVLDEDSAEVGLHANMIREDMHPLDECDVIMALCNDGQEDFDSVASRFGQTKRWVEQRISSLSCLIMPKLCFVTVTLLWVLHRL